MHKWLEVLLFGIGLGIIIEALILLSPLFETSLWETYCNFVKVIPIIALHSILLIGLLLVIIAVILEIVGRSKRTKAS